MSNMSYCRFENTSNDLQECIDALAGIKKFDELSDSEMQKAQEMYDQCQTYMRLFEEQEEAEEEEAEEEEEEDNEEDN